MAQTTTYLQLCKDVRQEAGISGDGPASVTNPTADEKKIVDWVRGAWLQIQRERSDWLFMVDAFTLQTEIGKMRYPLAQTASLAHLAGIKREFVTAYRATEGKEAEYDLIYLPDYNVWRQRYDKGVPANERPKYFTMAPNTDLLISPPADDVYYVRGEGRRKVQTLADNGDIIKLDDEYVAAIKWLAIMLFSGHEEAPTLYQHAEIQYNSVKRRLTMEQLPQFDAYVEPLA